jgi:hypothetical protein
LCLYVYPLLSQAIVPYQEEQASPKATPRQTRGRVNGNRLWKH